MLDILGKLLGGTARVKSMRLFLMNPEGAFDTKMISERAKISPASARSDVAHFLALGLVKRRVFQKKIERKNKKVSYKRTQGFALNPAFKYLEELRALVVGSEFLDKSDITKRFRQAGRVRFLAVSGVFMNEDRSRLDALVVVDRPNPAKLERIMRGLEAEIGKELTYAYFDTKEFLYRASMFDKLIFDMVEYPHETLVDTDQFSTQLIRKPSFA